MTTTPTPAPPLRRRCYYRCRLCLTAVTIEVRGQGYEDHFTCACGGGRLERLGMVSKARCVNPAMLCKCDARCTHASGPNCDCQCGGANHGAGMEGFIEGERDCGPVVVRPWAGSKSMERASEFRSGLASAIERLNERAGQRIVDETGRTTPEWRGLGYGFGHRALFASDVSNIAKATRMKVHGQRMKLLASVSPAGPALSLVP